MHKILKFYRSVEFYFEWNRYFEIEREIKFGILEFTEFIGYQNFKICRFQNIYSPRAKRNFEISKFRALEF